MAKGKARKGRVLALATAETQAPAARHTFSYGGLLGHDLTASPWIVNVSEQTALTLDVVKACVQVIADSVAGSDVGQWNDTTKIEPPSGFTLRPDPDMTRRDFLWLFAANLALYDAVYLEELGLPSMGMVSVRIHCIATVTRIGDDYYIAGKRVGNRMRLVRRSSWPTLDPDTGATLALAREVFAGAMAAEAFQSDYWQQGGAPVWYLKTDQPITDTQAEAISDRVVERRTTNPGKPMVLSSGADAKVLGADLGAAGISAAVDRLKTSIARYFNMPPDIINVASEAGPLQYQTDEQLMLRLVKITLQPYADVIGEALSAYLPGDYLLGDRIVIDLKHLLTADQLTRYQAYQLGIDAGWLLRSEVRAKENLPPLDGVDDVPDPAPVTGGLNVGA